MLNRKQKNTHQRNLSFTAKASPQSTEALLKTCCKDFEEWPASWAGFDEDIPVGRKIIGEFKPFLLDLIQRDRAKGTVKKYADYLWVLGGILIEKVHDDECLYRKLSGKDMICSFVDEKGGPLWHDARDERDHQGYDSVCRLLYKFITN